MSGAMDVDVKEETKEEGQQIDTSVLAAEEKRLEIDLDFSDFGQEANDEVISQMLQAAKEIDDKYQTLFNDFAQALEDLLSTTLRSLSAAATKQKQAALETIKAIYYQNLHNTAQRRKLAEFEASTTNLYRSVRERSPNVKLNPKIDSMSE